MRKCEPRQRERLHHGQSLRPYQHFAAVDAVDDDAGDGREQKCRYLACEANGAKQQGRLREPVDQPGRRDARHPCADQRDALAAEEESEIPMSQRPPGVRIIADERVEDRSSWGCFGPVSCTSALDVRDEGADDIYFATVSLIMVDWSTRAPAIGCCAITAPGAIRGLGSSVPALTVGTNTSA